MVVSQSTVPIGRLPAVLIWPRLASVAKPFDATLEGQTVAFAVGTVKPVLANFFACSIPFFSSDGFLFAVGDALFTKLELPVLCAGLALLTRPSRVS